MRKTPLRLAMPIYIIIGVLALMACVSIAIAGPQSEAESEIEGKDIIKIWEIEDDEQESDRDGGGSDGTDSPDGT